MIIPQYLAEPINRFSCGQGDLVYKCGSMAQAQTDCPREIVNDTLETLELDYEITLSEYELTLVKDVVELQKVRELGNDLETLEWVTKELKTLLRKNL